jgi:tripartite-type tricarboxylate transporter receptor subunit TctC
VLAVSTAKRSALMPGMPTLHETGVPGYDRTGWYGLLEPGTTNGISDVMIYVTLNRLPAE